MSAAFYSISLTLIALLTGVAILPVFARFSDCRKLLLAKRRIRAALYAFRLFGDEPRMVLRAQGQLLLWNARYLALMLKPAAIVALPVFILLLQVDAMYGHRALRFGEPALVTVRVNDAVDLNSASPRLVGSGSLVDSPAVRIAAVHRAFWRIRATETPREKVTLEIGGATASKSVRAGGGFSYLSDRRAATFRGWLLHSGEPRLKNVPVRWIQVDYPAADTPIFGMRIPWLLWFVIVSWLAMFALKKRFGVVL